MTSTKDLKGLVVLITGGARGIGRCTAERLARAGAKVAIGDLDAELSAKTAEEVSRATGGTVISARLDVTDPESWTSFLEAVSELGPVDVLVNNAGIMPLGSIFDEPHDVARRIMDINVHGVIYGTKAVGPGMAARGRGHIINIASAVGRVALPNGATYSASKFAVVGFTEAARTELAPKGVDVTMVLPSVVNTELGAGVPAARGVKTVQPEDVAEVIEHALHRPVAELWVPRWGQALAKGADLLPRRLKEATSRALKAESVLTDTDFKARAEYEARVRSGS